MGGREKERGVCLSEERERGLFGRERERERGLFWEGERKREG